MIDLSSVTSVIHLCTTNDRNGNPRRAYVAFSGSALRGAWQQGYRGIDAVPDEIKTLAKHSPSINVTPTEWRSWIKAAAGLDSRMCNR